MSNNQQRHEVGRRNAAARSALNMLAEKGSSRWTPSEQSLYDALTDAADPVGDHVDLQTARESTRHYLSAAHHAALDLMIRKSPDAMTEGERSLIQAFGQSTTVTSEGGALVPRFATQQLIDPLKSYGFMRQVASSLTTDSGAPLIYPGSDGTGLFEVGEQLSENLTTSSLDPTFFGVEIPTYKFGSKQITVPVELLQDTAVDMVQFVMTRAKQRIGRIQNQRFTTGTGTGQPRGLVTAASVGKFGLTGQTVSVIYEDLVDLVESVDHAHLGMPDAEISAQALGAVRPGWMMSQQARRMVRRLKDTAGRPIWEPGYAETGRDRLPYLLDHPVYINNDMPTPQASAKSIAFGNLGSYVIRDVNAIWLLRLQDSDFIRRSQVGFLMFVRSGGNLADDGGVKLYQHSAT